MMLESYYVVYDRHCLLVLCFECVYIALLLYIVPNIVHIEFLYFYVIAYCLKLT